MTEILSDTLNFLDNKRKQILPEYTRNGKPVYTLRKYSELTDLDAEVLLNGGVENVSQKIPTLGRSGNLLRTPRTAYAVNLDIAFDNRVKVDEINGDKVYIFVIDQRALMEQSSGHIYTDYVIGYVISKKKGNTKQVEVKEVIQVSEEDFINDYRAIFDTEKMEQIMEVINKYRFENGTKNIIESLDF